MNDLIELEKLPSKESTMQVSSSDVLVSGSVDLISLDAAQICYRLFEITVAVGFLLLTLPIMLLEAVLIKLGTPGPVLFFQERVGKGGRTFRFVKFRTMYADADKRHPDLYRYEYSPEQLETLVFKLKEDPRVTPQGRWLRRTSLDELPNFWNVLTGDMALVGPRPEIPEMIGYYRGELRMKFQVKPGITGLAQISGRGNLHFLETAALDLQYVRERSILLDLRILLKSMKCVTRAIGAF